MTQPEDAPRKGRDYTWFIVGAIAIVAALVVLFIVQPGGLPTSNHQHAGGQRKKMLMPIVRGPQSNSGVQ